MMSYSSSLAAKAGRGALVVEVVGEDHASDVGLLSLRRNSSSTHQRQRDDCRHELAKEGLWARYGVLGPYEKRSERGRYDDEKR